MTGSVEACGWKEGRDQPDNAARLIHGGAGLRISKNASTAKIAAAIQRVQNDPSFRTAALRLGDQLRAETDSGAALAELEALASAGRFHHRDAPRESTHRDPLHPRD
jgi:UDP:flavonoid glycosyltransferase YjiC (YdhE family)